MTPRSLEQIRWIYRLLKNIDQAPPRFRCFGLHEWAMVYHASSQDRRHSSFPLRLSPSEIAQVVDDSNLNCTHFDAFRFFTKAATPLNSCHPSLDSRLDLEQPGCIHTNMDLYKWAYKLTPWIPGELIVDSFDLAAHAREIDMRASPYDLRELGFPPICIETIQGKQEYEHLQRTISAQAAHLREKIIHSVDLLINLSLNESQT
ncbi:MAG: hypothetical protein AAF591_23120 [Verrucomicrobiota bacterium]